VTLAVASVFETGIRLYCYTRVLYPYGENPHYLRGTLKAITLHPGLCIAYAGDVASALSAIRDLNIHRSSSLSLPEVISHLEQTHSRTPKTTEFIVASAVEGQALTVIKEGRGSRVNYCWIGDIDAFEEYQRLFHTTVAPAPSTTIDPRLRADLEVVSRMHQAMEGIAASAGVRSVGELIIGVVLTADGLVYAPHAAMIGGRSQTIPSGVWTTVQFGGAAEGGFAYSVLGPSIPGIGAIGVHFYQARLGALFYPVELEAPALFRNVGHDEFRAAVRGGFGFDIQGPQIS
jgi:hypothetical protein